MVEKNKVGRPSLGDRKKITFAICITPGQITRLDLIAKVLGVNRSNAIGQAIDYVYAALLKLGFVKEI